MASQREISEQTVKWRALYILVVQMYVYGVWRNTKQRRPC